MNEIQIKGKQKFIGIEIPVIEGGFGEGQKVMLAKTIAEIHETRLDKVNELINNHLDEFEIGIDLLDLKKNKKFANLMKGNGLYTQNALNASKNIYLLSEQGYMLLVGFMNTEKAKEIRKQLRRDYFQMREIVNSNEQLKAMALLKATEGKTIEERLSGITEYTNIRIDEEKKPLEEEIKRNEPLVDFANGVISKGDNILVRELAKIITDNYFKIGEKRLYKKLREWGYIFKNSTEPTQYAMEREYFVVDTRIIDTPYCQKQVNTTKVTPKGQVYIVQRLLKEDKNTK